MNPKDDEMVDHANRNPLDNRKENLRICLNLDNSKNKRKLDSNTSGITGVTWYKARNKWVVHIMLNYKSKFLGYFIDFDKAVEVRLKTRERLIW